MSDKQEKPKTALASVKASLDWLRTFAATTLARRLVLALFVVQAATLAFVTRIGTPPDELNHIQFIEYYAHHSADPFLSHQQPTYNLGDKTREVDYIYHYVMSLVYRALPFSAHGKYLAIRLVSIVFALITIWLLVKLFKKLGVSAAAITVSLLVLTNLPMVLMMSSAINNDVLVWMGVVGGVLLLVHLWERPTALGLLWLASISLFGGLVKRDLLPVGLLFGALGLIILFKHARAIFGQLKRFNWHLAVAVVVLLLGISLFSERVGVNVVRYGTPTPSCDQVQGEAPCSVFWADIRTNNLNARAPETPIPLVKFVPRWFWTSFFNIVDIQTQAWRHQVKPARWLTPLLVTVMAIGVLYAFVYEKARFKVDKVSRYRVYVLLIALYYIGVMLAVNLSAYWDQHVWGLGLNGRYIIPSVLLLGGLAAFYWSKLLARRPCLLVALTVLVIVGTVLGSGLLMMLNNPQLRLG